MTRDKKQENILRTIENLKEEIISLPSGEDAEKLSQIKQIVQGWFSITSYFDVDDKPDYKRVKKSIEEETFYSIVSMFFDTYSAFYDIVKILNIK